MSSEPNHDPSSDLDLDGARFDGPWAGDVTSARAARRDRPSEFDIAVVGVPFDLAVTNRSGARFGPRAVREQSLLAGEFPWGVWPWTFNPFETHVIVDAGDVPGSLFWVSDSERMVAEVESHVRPLAARGAVLGIGGDHSISLPLVRAAAAQHGPLSLVHLDSHTDTWDMGATLNHGSMFRTAALEGTVVAERSAQIGIRTPNPDTLGFSIIDAHEFDDLGPRATGERVRSIVGSSPVYITVDIDVLDPAYAPGTGTPVSGGPSTGQVRRFLQSLAGLHVVGADVVEVAPMYDSPGQITALAVATIALDLVHLLAMARPAGQSSNDEPAASSASNSES